MTTFVIVFVLAFIAACVTRNKGYGPGLAVVVGLLGPVGLVIALVLPRKAKHIGR